MTIMLDTHIIIPAALFPHFREKPFPPGPYTGWGSPTRGKTALT